VAALIVGLVVLWLLGSVLVAYCALASGARADRDYPGEGR
jgi:hypothetical protein